LKQTVRREDPKDQKIENPQGANDKPGYLFVIFFFKFSVVLAYDVKNLHKVHIWG
jgi:hypothetical protein